MIDAFLRSIIGSFGNWLLDQYIANALWIHSLILGYALLVVLARRSFQSVLHFLVNYFQQNYGVYLKGKKREQIARFLEKHPLPWQQALKHAPFPLLSPPNSIRLYLRNESTFQKIFSPDLVAQAILSAKTTQKTK